MMPGTANSTVDQESLNERPVIVRAMRPDRKHLQPAAHQQHLLITRIADQLAAVGKLIKKNTLRQIGTAELRLILSHSLLLMADQNCIRSCGSAPGCILSWLAALDAAATQDVSSIYRANVA